MSNRNNKVYEIAILGRIVWNLHSLNNEGIVGNVSEPRTLVLADGTKTDGVSGEMLKHVHAHYAWQLVGNKTNALCSPCAQFNPEKANANEKVRRAGTPENAITEALIKCALCDLHGFLVERPTVSRESTVEFGWAVGLPQVHRQIHTHMRYSSEMAFISIEEQREPGGWENTKCSQKKCDSSPDRTTLYKVGDKWYCQEHLPIRAAQMIYHRPTRSGVYGIVSVFQPWRIGLNDVSLKYANNIDRLERYKLALEAYIAMLVRTEGAMTTTRLPHTEGFKGAVVYTQHNFPSPVISPLKRDYIKEAKRIAQQTNASVMEFDSLSKFVDIIKGLEGMQPWSG